MPSVGRIGRIGSIGLTRRRGSSALGSPTNTDLPTISGTTLDAGNLTLTSYGTWTGDPDTLVAHWLRDGAETGTTGVTYAKSAADDGALITARVLATNELGSATAESLPIGPMIHADYLITNDGGAGVANSFLNILALGGAALAGKRIGVADGNYTSKTIALNGGSGYATFFGLGSAAIIDKLVLGVGTTDVEITGLVLASSTWPAAGNYPACDLVGVHVGRRWIHHNLVVGNYQGVIDYPFDVTTSNYPEYAAIQPIAYGASGQITAIEIKRPYIAGLKADQLNMPIYSSGPPGTGFTGKVDIVGGMLTNARIDTQGTGYSSQGETDTITWSGQVKMVTCFPYGIQTGDGYSGLGEVRIEDNTFRLCANGLKGATPLGAYYVIGNHFDKCYQDCMSFGHANTDEPDPSTFVVAWNTGTRMFCKKGDPGDPHGDFLQITVNDLTPPYSSTDWEPEVYGNVYWDGATRGYAQGFLLGENPAGQYFMPRVAGNAVLSNYSNLGQSCDRIRDGFTYRNAFLRYNTTAPENVGASVTIRVNLEAAGMSFYGDNLAEADNFSVRGNFTTDGESNLFITATNTAAYAAALVAPDTNPTTLAGVVAAYTGKGAAAGKGPFGDTAYIDHVNRTIDRTLEPTVAGFVSLLEQDPAEPVSSGWVRMKGGPDVVNLTGMTNGTWQVANDAIGTGATTPTAADGVSARGKFLQINQTTSSDGSTTKVASVNLNGRPATFSTTTMSLASYLQIDNQGSARSTVARPNQETGLTRFLFAFRVRPDGAITSGANFFAESGGAALRLYYGTATAWRFQLGSSAIVHFRQIDKPPVLNTWQTHVIAIDLTKAAAADGMKWLVDGDLATISATGSVFDSIPVAGVGTRTLNLQSVIGAGGLGFFSEGDGGGTPFNGALEFFWAHWGTSSFVLPDITAPGFADQFTADNINLADGSGPLGFQPKMFYPGDANLAAWNDAASGVANRGSLSGKPALKTGGTYVLG